MYTAPENKAVSQAPPQTDLRSKVAELRQQQRALEREATEARWEADRLRNLIDRTRVLGNAGAADCARAREMLVTEEQKLSVILQKLAEHQKICGPAELMLAKEQALQAKQESLLLESEILSELRVFAEHMVGFAQQCAKIDALRRRAQELDETYLRPSVRAALYPQWGEIIVSTGCVGSRLALIAKCTALPENAVALVGK